MSPTRREFDSFGAIDVPADALWGAQTARSLHFFAIGEQRMPLALIHALAWVKWAAAGVNRRSAAARCRQGTGHCRCGPARGNGRIRCRVPAVGVADRLGHAKPHERQRGRGAAGIARARRGRSGASERRREPGPVFERCLPHGDAHRRVAAGQDTSAACAARVARRAGGEGVGIRCGGEDRSHAPAGRDAADAGPGVRRLRRATRPLPAQHYPGAARRACVGDRRHRGGHRAEHAPGVRRAHGRAAWPISSVCRWCRPTISLPRWPGTRRWWPSMPACACWPSR